MPSDIDFVLEEATCSIDFDDGEKT